MNRPDLVLLIALVLASWGIFVILILAMFYPHSLMALGKWLMSLGGEYA